MTEETRARGISLWLMPEGNLHDELTALIERLARRLDTVPFPPHVTLLPGVTGLEAEALDRARELAGELGPLALEPAGLDGLDAHFRCLFVRMAAFPELREAHARAARRFGREPDPSFDPHLSLVYGRLEQSVKTALKKELALAVPETFEAPGLHVWRTEGPVGEWRELSVLALGSGDID